MSDNFIGEIRMFTGNHPPRGWVFCDGQLLSIHDHAVLYSIVGTTYGGDGKETFALPDLRGRIPIHTGKNEVSGTTYPIGQMEGTEAVTLSEAELPAHTHPVHARSAARATPNPSNAFRDGSPVAPYATFPSDELITPPAILLADGNQAHDNVMPSFVINYIIALEGDYPVRDWENYPMVEPFLGEIRSFSFNYAPSGWMPCNGQLLKIKEHVALYTIIGTTYGGDGMETFALPNLQGRVPVQTDSAITLGQSSGEETHVLTIAEIPSHTHQMTSSMGVDDKNFVNRAQGTAIKDASAIGEYDAETQVQTASGTAGAGQGHPNMQPYTVIHFCISVNGFFLRKSKRANTDPLIGEIRLYSGKFAPSEWAFCDGKLMKTWEQSRLFRLIGTTYGGDGITTFALPDFRGRAPMHRGDGPGLSPRTIGQVAGTREVTLTDIHIPAHDHTINLQAETGQHDSDGAVWPATDSRKSPLNAATAGSPKNSSPIGLVGGGQPHNNMQPYLGLNFMISLRGMYPPSEND